MHSCRHFTVLFSSLQDDDNVSKRQAESGTESATAKWRPARTLSPYVKVEKDNNADLVVSCDIKVSRQPLRHLF